MAQAVTATVRRAPRPPGDARPGRGPETMAEMLGLGRPGLRVAVGAVMVAYVVVELFLPRLDLGFAQLTAMVVGSIGLAGSLCLATCGVDDPLSRPAAIVVVCLGAASGAVVWWSIPVGPANWVRPSAPMIAYAVAMCLLIVRGRARWAWLGFVLVIGLSWVAVAAWGWRPGTAVPVALRMLAAMVPASLMMLYVRPLLAFARVLDRREVAAVQASAAHEATLIQRRAQLDALNEEVRPFLERLSVGDGFSPGEVMRARLVEAELRDEVRGRGWMSQPVRDAAAAARERGVDVRLFDDRRVDARGGVADGPLHAELVAVLTRARRGGVTARLLPAGRDVVASIGESDGTRTRRRVCAVSTAGELAWRDDTGGASSD